MVDLVYTKYIYKNENKLWCIATAEMDYKGANIPEEYVDILVQEFAYDPIRLPPTEDPAQVLYNRRTLETIWDAKQEAVNPFTRQPFDISNVIPQAELRQEMHRYITNSSTLTLSLDVIPDYTKVLSEAEMLFFFNELQSDYLCLFIAAKEKRDLESEHHWKPLWQKFNLLRLYCQYRQENRDVFRSVGGYVYMSMIAEFSFYILLRYYSTCDHVKEIYKEAGRIVDIIGLKESDLSRDYFMTIATMLCCLARYCDQLKIQGMVLRIYCRMFYELNIENLSEYCLLNLCKYAVEVTHNVLGRENFRDIANEDLYNGMEILRAAWMKKQISCTDSEFNFLRIVVRSVILCISRFRYLHNATVANEVEKKNDEGEAKKVHLISVALEGGLSLINSIVTATSQEELENQFFSKSKERLHELDIVREIVGMVKLILAGFKRLGSSHLEFGLNIAAVLLKEEGRRERNDVVRVFGDFLGSGMVDEYDSHVKLLVQEIMQNENVEATHMQSQ